MDKNPDHMPSGDMDVDLEASFGETLAIPVKNLHGGLDSAVLMKPGAATHQFTADQMGLSLDASLDEDIVDVTIPEDLELLPGAYMLFVNEDMGEDGIFPSEAAWINLQ